MYCKMKTILLLVLSAIILSQSYSFVYADHEGSSHTAFTIASQTSEEVSIIEAVIKVKNDDWVMVRCSEEFRNPIRIKI